MRIFAMFPVLAVGAFLVAPLAAAANSPNPAPMKAPARVSVLAFGAANPACLEWTDGCVICARGDKGAHCSTPGVACQPAATICKKPAK